MIRSNLRSLPPLAPPTVPGVAVDAAGAERAEAELAGWFDELLARGQRDEEVPDYELLEAAVDGKLDPVEAELFSSRLAGDPVLQREFDDLAALRDLLQRRTATARPAATRRWIGFAAAAVLLAALGLGLRPEHRQAGSTTASMTSQREATPPSQGVGEVVFTDSFEGGTTDHWSN